jgi:hypothetical protein
VERKKFVVPVRDRNVPFRFLQKGRSGLWYVEAIVLGREKKTERYYGTLEKFRTNDLGSTTYNTCSKRADAVPRDIFTRLNICLEYESWHDYSACYRVSRQLEPEKDGRFRGKVLYISVTAEISGAFDVPSLYPRMANIAQLKGRRLGCVSHTHKPCRTLSRQMSGSLVNYRSSG